jgi:hypothetical protein
MRPEQQIFKTYHAHVYINRRKTFGTLAMACSEPKTRPSWVGLPALVPTQQIPFLNRTGHCSYPIGVHSSCYSNGLGRNRCITTVLKFKHKQSTDLYLGGTWVITQTEDGFDQWTICEPGLMKLLRSI